MFYNEKSQKNPSQNPLEESNIHINPVGVDLAI